MEPQAGNESMSGAEETVKPKNLFSRLIGVSTAPRATFEEIGRAPTIIGPIVVFMLVSFLLTLYLSLSGAAAAIGGAQLQALADRGLLSQEQLQQQLVVLQNPSVGRMMIGPILSLLGPLIVAAYAKLFTTFVSAENTFKKIFSAALFAWIPVSIAKGALIVLILTIKGPENAASGSLVASSLGDVLSAVLGQDALPGYLMRLLGYVELFNIWMIALMAIGFSAVSRKLKTSTAATWLIGAYAVYALIAAAASGLLSRGM